MRKTTFWILLLHYLYLFPLLPHLSFSKHLACVLTTLTICLFSSNTSSGNCLVLISFNLPEIFSSVNYSPFAETYSSFCCIFFTPHYFCRHSFSVQLWGFFFLWLFLRYLCSSGFTPENSFFFQTLNILLNIVHSYGSSYKIYASHLYLLSNTHITPEFSKHFISFYVTLSIQILHITETKTQHF